MKSQPESSNGSSRTTRSGTYSSSSNSNGSQSQSIIGPSPPLPKQLQLLQRTKPKAPAKGKKAKGGKKNGRFKVAYTNRKTVRILSESGNNELSKEDLSYLTEEEKLLLSSWGLPSTVLAVSVTHD